MIFKIYFQRVSTEVPVREETESMYVEGESVEEIRKKLAPHNYNIEFITPISGAYLEYEQQSDDFKVETL